jgi:hypothetical protein
MVVVGITPWTTTGDDASATAVVGVTNFLDDPEDRSEDDEDEDVGATGAAAASCRWCLGGVTGPGTGARALARARVARVDGCSCPAARSLCLVRDLRFWNQ